MVAPVSNQSIQGMEGERGRWDTRDRSGVAMIIGDRKIDQVLAQAIRMHTSTLIKHSTFLLTHLLRTRFFMLAMEPQDGGRVPKK